ncbi:MAG: type I secretion C-terminal target domain-containing protein [Ramlibacter sp.]|nr:type I secretion C-terminal target domain-containing protein [Ramlibacter sp.]
MRVTFESNEFYPVDGDFIYGDSDSTPDFVFTGGNDTFVGEDGNYQYGAVGDVYGMSGTSRGGNDTFYGGDFAGDGYSNPQSGVVFIGDAMHMTDRAVGGRDYAEGGINSSNYFVGDASDATDHASGGNDTLIGGDAFSDTDGAAMGGGNAFNFLFGDFNNAGGFGNPSRGTFFIKEPSTVRGGQDSIVGGDSWAHQGQALSLNLLSGDSYAFSGYDKGGDDTIRGGDATASDGSAGTYNIMLGDAFFMSDAAIGGRDVMYGGDARVLNSSGEGYAINYMVGDSLILAGDARGSNDEMYGGDARVKGDGTTFAVAFNIMAGDTFDATSDGVSFGKDTMVGGDGSGDGYAINVMYGDIGFSDSGGLPFPFLGGPFGPVLPAGKSLVVVSNDFGSHHFANDKITGGSGNAENFLVGDAHSIGSDSQGGNDILVAGDGYHSAMVGDSIDLWGKGGNDRLYSGQGNDEMWGDAQNMHGDARGGADRFFFGPDNGNDVIYDFHVRDKDRIDLSAFSSAGADFRNFAAFMTSGRAEQTDDGVVLHLDLASATSEDNTVLLMGVELQSLVRASFSF